MTSSQPVEAAPGGTARRSGDLPATESLYRTSIERERAAANSRFNTSSSSHTLGLARSASGRSFTNARSMSPSDQLERGASPHDVAASSSYDDGSFVPQRPRNDKPSILPSSAFFAPKKPNNQRAAYLGPSRAASPSSASYLSSAYSPGTAVVSLPAGASGSGYEYGTLSGPTSSASALGGSAPGLERRHSGETSQSTGTAPVMGYGAGSSEGHGGPRGSTGLKAEAIEAYRNGNTIGRGPRGQASRDPLLPFSNANGGAEHKAAQRDAMATIKGSPHSLADQAFTPRNKRSSGKPLPEAPGSSSSRTGKQSLPASASSQPQQGSAARPPRNYKQHRGSNRFFCGGLIMMSDDNPLAFLGSLALMIALAVLWLIDTAPYVWKHVSPAPVIIFAYIWAVGFVSMCVTAWRDPGVLPRNLDPDPPCSAGETGGYLDPEDPLAVPLPRVIRLRNDADLKVKWCETCGTYRPPRSSHCRVCDNCVENIDHHCTFLNTCIGRRNYFSFFAFLVFAILAACLCVAFSIVHLYLLTRPTTQALPGGGFGEGLNFRQALAKAPIAAVTTILPALLLVPVGTLLAYHVRLVAMNRTTVEQIRINTTRSYGEKPAPTSPYASHDEHGGRCRPSLGRPGLDPNPFAYPSPFRNVVEALVRPASLSWIDPHGRKQPDTRRPNPAWKGGERA